MNAVEVKQEHVDQVADGIKRMMTREDWYRFTNRIRPRLIVYCSGAEWHVATHDGTAVSRIWSTHPRRELAVAAYKAAQPPPDFAKAVAEVESKPVQAWPPAVHDDIDNEQVGAEIAAAPYNW